MINKIGIYKITSPSNKVYIGQSIDIHNRRLKYKRLTVKGQIRIYRSLLKYGFDAHNFDIIEECSIEQLNEREIYYKQLELNKVQGDWNQVLFCDLYDKNKGGYKSEETKRKISEANKGRSKPKNFMGVEHKQKLSKANKGKPKPNGFGTNHSLKMRGKILTEESKNKIGKANSKIVLQYDNQNKLIKEWTSATEAEIYFSNDKKKDVIASCCRGIRKNAYKFIFKYKNNG